MTKITFSCYSMRLSNQTKLKTLDLDNGYKMKKVIVFVFKRVERKSTKLN